MSISLLMCKGCVHEPSSEALPCPCDTCDHAGELTLLISGWVRRYLW